MIDPIIRKSFRIYSDDQEILDYLGKRWGIPHDSHIIRFLLRLYPKLIEQGLIKENSILFHKTRAELSRMHSSSTGRHRRMDSQAWKVYEPDEETED